MGYMWDLDSRSHMYPIVSRLEAQTLAKQIYDQSSHKDYIRRAVKQKSTKIHKLHYSCAIYSYLYCTHIHVQSLPNKMCILFGEKTLPMSQQTRGMIGTLL